MKKQWLHRVCVLILCLFTFVGCENLDGFPSISVLGESDFRIHVIDVGQGDSILVQSGTQTLLIDAGENAMGQRVVDYLDTLGITRLDYIIGTHPHSDHIGGLDDVIDAYPADIVILPSVSHTTRTYEDVLTAIYNRGLKVTKPVVGTEYTLGDATFQIIAPNSEVYDDLNDYSVGIRVVYGDTSYVFAGDADAISEEEMCKNGLDLSADVLKLNHHGSSYSNNKDFIDAVSPSDVVISVGADNSYGHPHKEVLADMKERGINVYRTDVMGTIVIISDGKHITIQSISASDIQDEGKSTTNEVYVTKSGSKYHKEGCTYIKGEYNLISADEAEENGYDPCSRCYATSP